MLSTLRTNMAIGAVSRLGDMGVDRFLLAPMLRGLVAQPPSPTARRTRGGDRRGAWCSPPMPRAPARPCAPGLSSRSRSRPRRRAGRAPRLATRAQVLLTRQLATLIGSGVRIEAALRTVADQSHNARLVALCLDLRASVMDGQGMAHALDAYPGEFDTFYRASVRAGEASGKLGQVMDHLADLVGRRAGNRQTVQLALLYPSLLAVVSVGVIVALVTFVVPDIVRVFSLRGAELPFLTRALIAVSDGVGRYGPFAAAGLAGTVAPGRLALRAPARRRAWHRT